MGSPGQGEGKAKARGSRLVRAVLVLIQLGLGVVAWVYFSDRVAMSPGPLVGVHAKDPLLAGSSGCKTCHGPRNGACTSETCSSCHADIRDQIVRGRGFHGILEHGKGNDCGNCHGEHKGPEFAPVNVRSFSLAGFADVSTYRHDGLPFHLDGRHLTLECSKCHPAADAGMLDKGQKRYLGLSQECANCHRDVHQGAYGPDCQACHGQSESFKTAAAFRHTDAFPLEGSHSGLACIACHAEGTPTSIAALLAERTKGDGTRVARTCVACHANPHRADFVSRTAVASSISAENSCVLCHSASHPSFFGPSASLTRKQHAQTGFPLAPPHQKVACSACHAGFGTEFPVRDAEAYHRRYPSRRPEDCRACHGDPHRGDFEVGAFKGKDCLSCHDPQAWRPSLFDASFHDRAAFRLEGRHRKLQCTQCHPTSKAGSPPVYHGTPTDCRSCHKDPHGGQFDTAAYRGNECRACHGQDTFKASTFTVVMHARTAFPLTGAHLAISCSRCHSAPSGAAGEVGVRRFAGLAAACSSCHADVHAGRFDGPGVPSVVSGRTDCARCHGTESFRTFPEKAFDHALWTGYALAGAHAKADCAACHGRGAPETGKGRTLGFAAGRQCQSCHTDPHAGQFGPTVSVNCAKCHGEEKSFHRVTFDHQKDSRFRLDEVHIKLECAQCHRPMTVAPGLSAVRYKPLGIQCGDCHDPRGPKRQP